MAGPGRDMPSQSRRNSGCDRLPLPLPGRRVCLWTSAVDSSRRHCRLHLGFVEPNSYLDCVQGFLEDRKLAQLQGTGSRTRAFDIPLCSNGSSLQHLSPHHEDHQACQGCGSPCCSQQAGTCSQNRCLLVEVSRGRMIPGAVSLIKLVARTRVQTTCQTLGTSQHSLVCRNPPELRRWLPLQQPASLLPASQHSLLLPCQALRHLQTSSQQRRRPDYVPQIPPARFASVTPTATRASRRQPTPARSHDLAACYVCFLTVMEVSSSSCRKLFGMLLLHVSQQAVWKADCL